MAQGEAGRSGLNMPVSGAAPPVLQMHAPMCGALEGVEVTPVVAADCQLILFLTCDTILAGDEFRSQTHDVWLATEFLLWAVQRVGDKVRAHMQPTNKCINALTILKPERYESRHHICTCMPACDMG